jgi:hypothetical protein
MIREGLFSKEHQTLDAHRFASMTNMKYWEIIADKLSGAGWSWGPNRGGLERFVVPVLEAW